MSVNQEFRSPGSAEALCEHLRAHPSMVPVGTATLRRVYLDTLDWRLAAAGLVLEAETTVDSGPGGRSGRAGSTSTSRVARHRTGTRLILRDQQGAVVAGTPAEHFDPEPTPDPTRTNLDDGADLLPAGDLRDEVAPLLALRALLVRATVTARRHDFGVRNREEKTVARVTVEHVEVHGAEADLPPRLVVEPVRGYQGAARRLAETLAAEVPLEPAEQPRAADAMAVAGCRPGDYSAKLRVAVDPGEPAPVALARIFTHLLVTMERNEHGLRDDRDTEFLHDFRVAARRTRSLLKVARRVLSPAELEPFEQAFKRVAAATGDARDLDVHLLDFDPMADALPAEWRSDLEPLRHFLVIHRQRARAEVLAMLDGADWAFLRRDWRAYLTAAMPDAELVDPAGGNAESATATPAAAPNPAPDPDADGDPGPTMAGRAPTAAELGAWAVRRSRHRVVRDGRRIHDETPASDLHELRKRAKVLRYVLEAFGSALGDGTGDAVRELKGLQDVLGDFQDCDVQIDTLRRFAEQMADERIGGPDTFMAMGLCLSGRLDEKEHIRARFASAFERFDSDANAELYASLTPEHHVAAVEDVEQEKEA